ncbi:MAG: hypothetical protein KC729_00330, partial [Candidatus Eisenbacteria bacterium]|nr:hypothetical protein [Candidatus Eisenbacteria bacterium]
GVHILASGNIGANASLGLEADLVAGTRARGVDGWQNQSLRGNLSRGPWELTGGDFAVDPTDLVAPAFSGRGAQVGFRSEAGAVRVARVRNREDAHIHSWDVEAQRILPLRFQVHGEVLQRELEIIGRRPRQDRIASGALIWGDRDGLRIAGEIGVSQSADSSGSTAGRATQLSFRAGSSRATLRGRINVGSRDFTGRTGDRDGVVLFGSWSPRQSPFRLWSNLETTDGRAWATGDSTGSRVSRARAGVRWDARQWPGVEISGGRLTDVSTLGSTTVRSSERSDVTLATTFARGPALLVGTLDHGLVHDRLTGSSGGVRSLELNAGTRIADFRTALHWSQSTDWSPDARSAIESHGWQADLSYYAGSGLVDAGVSLSRRTQLSGTLTQPPALLRIEPRLDVRIAQRWTLRLDASIERVDGDARVNRWQLSVHRSAIELLPVPWVPLRGGVRGVVFIDADGDGRPGPTEERIEDILIRADGRYQTTDRHGEFSWSSLDPGTYWLEVDRGSIPAGMALSVGLPIEVVIDAGRDQDLWIPLAPCGTVRGSLFLDENRDGRIGDEEPGVSDLRIALWRGDDQVAVAMTDTDGGFQLRQVPAGRYELRIDPQWIPRGWEPTTREVWVDVTEDSPTTVAPYGIAPRRKPVVITYPGRGATERP